jgi:hypothetical protein
MITAETAEEDPISDRRAISSFAHRNHITVREARSLLGMLWQNHEVPAQARTKRAPRSAAGDDRSAG